MKLLVLGAFLASTIGGLSVTLAAPASRSGSSNAIAKGSWGGDHAVVEISGAGAAIQLDCAHGTVPRSIILDANGRFDVEGEFVPEHGGPIRVGEAERRQPARYSGRVRGTTMTFSIDRGADEGNLGPFTVELGNAGRIVRCR